MASVNKVILVGNLGRDPETKYMPDGAAITNVSLATSYRKKNAETDEVEWHRVVFFERLAEIAGEYLKKGSQIYIEGRIRTRKWQDKEGQDRYSTEVVASSLQMLGTRQGNGEDREERTTEPQPRQAAKPAAAAPAGAGARKNGGYFDDMEDDIPF